MFITAAVALHNFHSGSTPRRRGWDGASFVASADATAVSYPGSEREQALLPIVCVELHQHSLLRQYDVLLLLQTLSYLWSGFTALVRTRPLHPPLDSVRQVWNMMQMFRAFGWKLRTQILPLQGTYQNTAVVLLYRLLLRYGYWDAGENCSLWPLTNRLVYT